MARSLEEVARIISAYERATIARFVVEHQSTKFMSEDWHGKKLFRWSLKGVPSCFGPAIVIGTKVLCCHQGKDRHVNFKKLKREQTRLKRLAKDQGFKEKDPTARKLTKKVNCPAAISIKKVAFFPDYQVTEATPHRKRMACKRFNQDRVKRPERIRVDIKFFVTLPDAKDHKNHLSGDDLFKKIMTNRSLYDPQGSLPKKKKKKKKSKKHRKREKKAKESRNEDRETEENLDDIEFSFLPSSQESDQGDNDDVQCGMSDSGQLLNVAGQPVSVARQGSGVAGQVMCVTQQGIGVVGRCIDVAGHGMGVVRQDVSASGQSIGVAGQSMGVAGQSISVAGQELNMTGHDEDVGQDLITLDRRQLLPMDHL